MTFTVQGESIENLHILRKYYGIQKDRKMFTQFPKSYDKKARIWTIVQTIFILLNKTMIIVLNHNVLNK